MSHRAAPGTSAPWALGGLALSMLLASLGISSANVALPTLTDAFDASFQQVQWVVLSYLLAITTLIVSVGRLGDRIGRKRLLLAGIAAFTAASLLAGVAPALWLLIAARVLQGLGAAVLMALTLAFVGDTVPKERTGSAMGLLGTMSAIGTALGPSAGGVLIAASGWRAVFLVNVPLGLVTLALVCRNVPGGAGPVGRRHTRFGHAGTATLALALGAYTLAMTSSRGHFGWLNVMLLGASLVGIGTFVAVERVASEPLVRPGTLRDVGLRAGLFMNTLVSTVMMSTLVVGPFYLTATLGLGPAAVGLALAAGPGMVAATAVPAGRAADRFGARRMTRVGLAGILGGALLLAMLPRGAGVTGYVASVVMMTLGYATFQTANNAAVMLGASPTERGVTSGMLTLSRNLGLVTGASAMGAVFAVASGTRDIANGNPASVAFGTRTSFAVAALLMAVALAVAVRTAGHARQAH